MSFLGRSLLQAAREKGIALCGFDAFNMESAQAVVRAAQRLGVPLFLQTGIESARYMGLSMAQRILKEAKQSAQVEICIHLDHGPEPSDINELAKAIELGYESIMVDGSTLSLEENISLSKQIIEIAHPRGACVECELGKVSRDLHATKEELKKLMTDPEEAAKFVAATGVDYLAVSVGSVSGSLAESGKIQLDLDRLKRIAELVPCPLVFHGGTGIPQDQLKEAVKLGVAKVNIAHGLRKAFVDGIAGYLVEHPQAYDPRKVLAGGTEKAEEFACAKIKQLALN